MRRAAFVAACTLGLGSAAVYARQGDAPTLDAGVYTIEQGKRGRVHYGALCASCHVGDLSGTLAADAGAPPLRGTPFVTSMEKKGLAAVFDYMKTTMPADDPGFLDDSEYLEILAYLLEANGFPPGSRELTIAHLPNIRTRPASSR